MLISGLQKFTLSDYPGKVACIVFTGGCNLACPYCHNSEIIKNPPHLMEEGEFLEFLEGKRGKLDGVVVSGGEPCIHSDLADFIKKIKEMEFLVKLDTNGFFFESFKDIAENVGLDYVAIDIKNDPAHMHEATGVKCELDEFKKTIEYIVNSNMDYEFRTTVVKPIHTVDSICGIRDFLKEILEEKSPGAKVPHYYLQPFVDRETVAFSGLGAPDDEEMKEYKRILSDVASEVILRG